MIIGYCRVSTEKSEQDHSIEGQEAQLYQYGCDKVFAERRSAYKSIRRPQWEKFKKAVESGLATKAVLINLQRTSRRCEAESFFDRCREVNVEVVVLDGTNVDTRDVSGFVMVRTMETINKMESMMKAQSVKAGQQRRRAAGATAVGRCPFGYRYNGVDPVPHPEQWDDAKKLWADLEEIEFVANRLIRSRYESLPAPYTGMPTSGPGLYRWIKNKMLIGIVEYPGLPTRRTEPLVSEESWYRAQRLLEQRHKFKTRRRENTLYLFTQLVHCQACGHVMTPAMQAGKIRLKHGHTKCEYWGKGLAEFKVKDQVIEALRSAALADVAAKPEQVTADPAKRLQLDKLLALQNDGVPGLEESIAGIRRELEIETTETSANWAGYKALLSRPGILEAMPDEELRAVLLEFVDQILYIGDPNRVEIRLRDSSGTRSA